MICEGAIETFLQFSADDDTAEEEEEEEEDSDEQPAPVVTTRQSPRARAGQGKSPAAAAAATTASGGSLRQRFQQERETTEREGRFTPTPRRSIHSYKVTETTKQVLTRSPDGRQLSQDFSYQKEEFKVISDAAGTVLTVFFNWSNFQDGVRVGAGGNTWKTTILSLLPKLFMLIIFAAVVYYTIQVRKSLSFLPPSLHNAVPFNGRVKIIN